MIDFVGCVVVKQGGSKMKKMVIHLSLVAIAALSTFATGASEITGATAQSQTPKAVLEKVQDKLNKAKAISMILMEEKGGVKVESKCMVKQYAKGEISFRQEQRAILPGGPSQPLVTIMDHNKLYMFPVGCGNVVVRMKYLETREPDSPLANLFFSEGTFERISESDADCSIRYVCTPAEVKALKVAIGKKTGVEIPKDMTPAVLEYKISKKSQTLREATIYSERGKLITRQLFKDWRFDIEIPDLTFEIPKGFKQYVVKSAKDAEKLQAELMKVALAEQAKKQQQQNKQQKK